MVFSFLLDKSWVDKDGGEACRTGASREHNPFHLWEWKQRQKWFLDWDKMQKKMWEDWLYVPNDHPALGPVECIDDITTLPKLEPIEGEWVGDKTSIHSFLYGSKNDVEEGVPIPTAWSDNCNPSTLEDEDKDENS